MAILIINPMESICGDCGKGCDYTEHTHTTQMGYTSDCEVGCGAVFDSVGSDYVGELGEVGCLRPDLEFVPVEKVPERVKFNRG